MNHISKTSRLLWAGAVAFCLGVLPLAGCSGATTPDSAGLGATPPSSAGIWAVSEEHVTQTPLDENDEKTKDVSPEYDTKYEYDEAGCLVKQSDIYKGEVDSTTTFTSDENGWFVEYTSSGKNQEEQTAKLKNEVDSNGMLVHQESDDGLFEVTYEYNGDYVSKEVDTYYNDKDAKDDPAQRSQTTIVYNPDGSIASRTYDLAGTLVLQEFTYERDEQQRPVKMTMNSYDLDENLQKTSEEPAATQEFTYDYDENGKVSRTETEYQGVKVVKELTYVRVENPSRQTKVNDHILTF